ncbi:MAG: toxic anion resistance protein [Agathobacter sp.]
MGEITLADLAKSRKNEVAQVEKEEALVETAQPDFTEEEKQRIVEIRKGIDFTDSQAVIQYGVGAQRELSEFSDSILNNVRNKDTGYVGDLLSELVVQVKSMDVTKSGDGGILNKIPFVKDAKHSLEKMKERYAKVEVQIDRIEGELEKARMEMLKDINMFDTMYQKNLSYFKELQLYIAAGEQEIEKMRKETIPALQAEAAKSGDPMDAQMVSDFEDTVNRFEKKMYDLKLSKTIAIQSAPQIKLIQNNDKLLVDRIQTAILNTIPVWKGQIVIALGLYKQEKALKLQQEITDTTNELLKKNSELLKTNTIETAKASEKGIVELETLQKVNNDLISTIEETIKIQQEGRIKRQAAEQELLKLEGELKSKLMTR